MLDNLAHSNEGVSNELQVGGAKGRGLLLLAEMSSKGALATGQRPYLHLHQVPAVLHMPAGWPNRESC